MSQSKTRPLVAPILKNLAPRTLLARVIPRGSDVESSNVRNALLEGVVVGFANAASPFLPVLLARLGASNFTVGLLTAMPAFAGFLFALPISRFLSRQPRIVPFFALSRFLTILPYALSALALVVVPTHPVEAILIIWAFATLPQTLVNITFTIVMAGIAGPNNRFSFMSRRWSLLGFTNAVSVALAGFVLDQIIFPLNYEIVFIVLALGGMASYYFSNHIVLPAQTVVVAPNSMPFQTRVRNWLNAVRRESRFVRFTFSQFIFRLGLGLALPLYPLFYVRELRADDTSIGLINTASAGVLLGAYFMWTRITRRQGVRFALLATTLAISLYPVAVAATREIWILIMLAGLAGIFLAGIDLVFFDTLISSLPASTQSTGASRGGKPPESSAMFVGLFQLTVYVSTFVGPLVGTALSGFIGIGGALVVAGAVCFVGFGLFAYLGKK